MAEDPIYYFDNNATTKIADEVIEAMMPFFTDQWGNASAAYRFGTDVSLAIRMARGRVAELMNAEPEEIIFTSRGTESNNAARRAP